MLASTSSAQVGPTSGLDFNQVSRVQVTNPSGASAPKARRRGRIAEVYFFEAARFFSSSGEAEGWLLRRAKEGPISGSGRFSSEGGSGYGTSFRFCTADIVGTRPEGCTLFVRWKVTIYEEL